MKMSRTAKWLIGILSAILLLSFLIPFGIRCVGQEMAFTPDAATDTSLPAKTTAQTETPPQTEMDTPVTLEALLGNDYVQIVTDTITMQMGNRMDKNPDVQFYPITDNAPLSDYVTIGEETEFEVDDEGYLVIRFPAGTVTSADNGVQRFRIYQVDTNAKTGDFITDKGV